MITLKRLGSTFAVLAFGLAVSSCLGSEDPAPEGGEIIDSADIDGCWKKNASTLVLKIEGTTVTRYLDGAITEGPDTITRSAHSGSCSGSTGWTSIDWSAQAGLYLMMKRTGASTLVVGGSLVDLATACAQAGEDTYSASGDPATDCF